MFRDDHEAALARIAALEAELARAREDDVAQAQRIERLEDQLAVARRKLTSTEEELDQHRPRPRSAHKPSAVRRPVAASEPVAMHKQASDRGAAIAVAVLLVAIVVVGLVLMVQSGSLHR